MQLFCIRQYKVATLATMGIRKYMYVCMYLLLHLSTYLGLRVPTWYVCMYMYIYYNYVNYVSNAVTECYRFFYQEGHTN